MKVEELVDKFRELALTADESDLSVLSGIISSLQTKRKKKNIPISPIYSS